MQPVSSRTPAWIHWTLRHWRLLLFVFIVVSASMVFYFSGLKDTLSLNGIQGMKDHLLEWGWKGAVGYFALYVVVVTFGLPNLPFQLAAGAIYGVWPAYLMMYIGVNAGALGAFYLSRTLGRSGIEELWGHRVGKLNQRIESGGFRYVVILRLIPLLPFNAINYASGLSRLSLKTYVSANAVGMLPLTLVHVFLGSAATNLIM